MENQVIKIELLQGENAPLVFMTELSKDAKLDEVSGTLAYRILKLREKVKKYRINLGFSFARKFDVQITIDGQSANGTEVNMASTVKFGVTVQSNDKSYKDFHGFISELVEAILTGENKAEGVYNDLKSGLEHGKSVSKGAKNFLKIAKEELILN